MHILVAEPSREVATLLAEAVGARGNVAEVWDGRAARGGEATDLLIGEPVDPLVVALAHRLRSRLPRLPIVWVSIAPPTHATRLFQPSSHLVKPFALSRLEQAVDAALAAV